MKMKKDNSKNIIDTTISDFDYQWKNFGAIQESDSTYMNSAELLADLFQGFLTPKMIEGKVIAEIGSGHGRLIRSVEEFKPKKVFAIEPGKNAIKMAEDNLKNFNNITFINKRGDNFSLKEKLDVIFSIGVIHHIADPIPVINNIYDHLKPGGKFLLWVYGKEGNKLYLLFYNFISKLTKSTNNKMLMAFSRFLTIFTYPYGYLCYFLPLPLRGYFLKVFNKFDFYNRALVVFDQLNPSYAKYYSKKDLEDLIQGTKFSKVKKMSHRAGYSWTAICEKKS